MMSNQCCLAACHGVIALLCSHARQNDPDYSCAYVVLTTDTDVKGYGLTFTLGNGTDIGKTRLETSELFIAVFLFGFFAKLAIHN